MTDLGPGIAAQAAKRRLEAFAASIERLGVEDFRQIALSDALAPDREAARAEATQIAARAGLRDVLDEARRDAEEYVLRLYSAGGFRPTWVGLNWGLSLGRTTDRVTAIVAVQDAVAAAAIEPYASDELLATLRDPLDLIASARSARRAPSLAGSLGIAPRRLATVTSVGVVVIAVAVALLIVGITLAPR